MTKQETIKQHYITEFINSGMAEQESEKKYLIVNKYIDEENGKCEVSQNSLSLNLKNIEYFETVDKWRPISLRGIETNNGWTSILSEKDLPSDESVKYEVANINGSGVFDFTTTKEGVELKYKNGTCTHYKVYIPSSLPPLH